MKNNPEKFWLNDYIKNFSIGKIKRCSSKLYHCYCTFVVEAGRVELPSAKRSAKLSPGTVSLNNSPCTSDGQTARSGSLLICDGSADGTPFTFTAYLTPVYLSAVYRTDAPHLGSESYFVRISV